MSQDKLTMRILPFIGTPTIFALVLGIVHVKDEEGGDLKVITFGK
jgi:hypothetical protein